MKSCPTCAATYANDVAFCPRDGAALRSTAGLEPGAVIRKKYQIIGEIGRGGMGVVYRARHLIWNEEKALKVLTAEGAGLQHGLKGLMAEALVMRHLQHPHIVRVEDADYTEDDQPFVVMEYVAGQSVRERLQSSGTLAPELALRIAADTCSALVAAHQKGIIHRDIKPQNLLLAKGADGGESVKVIDFGIAKVREDAGLGFTGPMTGTAGLFVCTPAYASPEQAQGMRGNHLDGRSDLYSLGLVLYEMLSGRLPFAAPNPEALLWQRLQVQPLPLDKARVDLTFPPAVAGVVMKALERERENRYQSAAEMGRAIATALDSRKSRAVGEEGTVLLDAEQVACSEHRKRSGRGGTTREKGEPGHWRRPLAYCAAVLGLLAGLVTARYVLDERLHDAVKPVPKAMAQREALAAPSPPLHSESPGSAPAAEGEQGGAAKPLQKPGVVASAPKGGTPGAEGRAAGTKISSAPVPQSLAKTARAQLGAQTGRNTGTVNDDVSSVKSDLESTADLERTIDSLNKTTGDLGVQSGYIATNSKELAVLRRLGQRNYYEFNLGKAKQPQRVGDITMLLMKADPQHNEYSVYIYLVVDDVAVEKKDKKLNEPVQFFRANTRQPYELVVNEIETDRIVGYLATPKDTTLR